MIVNCKRIVRFNPTFILSRLGNLYMILSEHQEERFHGCVVCLAIVRGRFCQFLEYFILACMLYSNYM